MKIGKISLAIIAPIFIILFFVIQVGGKKDDNVSRSPTPTSSAGITSSARPAVSQKYIFDSSRITKKPFGVYSSPGNSTVENDRFTRYHSGIDLEATGSEEANIDVPVPALCDGPLLQKRQAGGYGGVVVQSCFLAGGSVTVVYGHVKLSSVTALVGQELKRGDRIGVLGKGFSSETDGERKHLHLGIHKGTAVSILGYVPKQSDLSAWLDPVGFLK